MSLLIFLIYVFKNVYYFYSACSNPTNVFLVIVLSMIIGKGAWYWDRWIWSVRSLVGQKIYMKTKGLHICQQIPLRSKIPTYIYVFFLNFLASSDDRKISIKKRRIYFNSGFVSSYETTLDSMISYSLLRWLRTRKTKIKMYTNSTKMFTLNRVSFS